MKTPTELERAVLEKCLEGDGADLRRLREQLPSLRVKQREWTGVGFYTTFETSELAQVACSKVKGVLSDVHGAIDGLKHGAAFVLFVEKGQIAMLEGVTYDEPWPDKTEKFWLSFVGGEGRAAGYVKEHLSDESD